MKRALLVLLLACGPGGTRATAPSGAKQASPPVVAVAPACAPASLSPVLAGALRALAERRFAAADDALLDHLEATPGDAAADMLLDAVRDTVEEERKVATALDGSAPVRLDLSRSATPHAAVTEAPPDLAPDNSSRMSAYGAKHSVFATRRFRPPPWHAPVEGTAGERHLGAEDGAVATFAEGQTGLVITTPRGRPLHFDLPASPLHVDEATMVDDVVLARFRGGSIAAFDAASGQLLWRAPVSHGVVAGRWVLSEGERGVDVRDVHTGAVVRTVSVPAKVRAVTTMDGKVYAILQNDRIELRSGSSLVPAPPKVQPVDRPAFWADPRSACALTHAVAALVARDVPKVDAALADVHRNDAERAVVRAIRRQRERLVAWAASTHADRVDLFASPTVALHAPPWKQGKASPVANRVRFRQVRAKKQPSWERDEERTVTRTAPVSIAPAGYGVVPLGARQDIPRFFGVGSLVALEPFGGTSDDALLFYGDRFLAIVRGQRAERMLDLDAYRHPPFVPAKGEHVFPGPPTSSSAARRSRPQQMSSDSTAIASRSSPTTRSTYSRSRSRESSPWRRATARASMRS